MKTAIVIGHDKTKVGAFSPFLNQSEYVYNSEVACYLKSDFDVYKRPIANGYKTQMQILANELNPKKYDLVVELHFNAFNKKAQGVETLSYIGNQTSLAFGNKYCKIISENYNITNRGAKFVNLNGNGYWFSKLINAHTLILEPFFGDEKQSEKFKDHKNYACHLSNFLKSL